MAGYGRDYSRYDRDRSPGWTGGGVYPGAGYRSEGYFSRPRRYERGLEIGPVWGGGSDIGYRAAPVPRGGYDRGLRSRRVFRAGGYDRDRPAPRHGPPSGYDWRYW